MPGNCIAPNCPSTTLTPCAFHHFPDKNRRPDVYQKWIDALNAAYASAGFPPPPPAKKPRLCEMHFFPHDYCDGLAVATNGARSKRLRHKAVPFFRTLPPSSRPRKRKRSKLKDSPVRSRDSHAETSCQPSSFMCEYPVESTSHITCTPYRITNVYAGDTEVYKLGDRPIRNRDFLAGASQQLSNATLKVKLEEPESPTESRDSLAGTSHQHSNSMSEDPFETSLHFTCSTSGIINVYADALYEGPQIKVASSADTNSSCSSSTTRCDPCGECPTVRTSEEKVCCRELPQIRELLGRANDLRCITEHKDFRALCLGRAALQTAYVSMWMFRSGQEGERTIKSSRQYRQCAYRQFVCFIQGGRRLGKVDDIVIPACVVQRVRREFPTET